MGVDNYQPLIKGKDLSARKAPEEALGKVLAQGTRILLGSSVWTSLQYKTKSNSYPEDKTVKSVGIWNERDMTYPGRSHEHGELFMNHGRKRFVMRSQPRP